MAFGLSSERWDLALFKNDYGNGVFVGTSWRYNFPLKFHYDVTKNNLWLDFELHLRTGKKETRKALDNCQCL